MREGGDEAKVGLARMTRGSDVTLTELSDWKRHVEPLHVGP